MFVCLHYTSHLLGWRTVMTNSIRCTGLLLFAILMSLIACSREAPVLTGATMGTTYSVIVPHLKRRDRDELKAAIDSELLQINNAMSTYQDDSAISRFNSSTSTDWFEVSAGFTKVVDASLKIAVATEGAFDPTIGPLVKLWGFGKDDTDSIPSTGEIALLMQQAGFKNLVLDAKKQSIKKSNNKIQLDLNAIAKGFAVDQLATHVKSFGYTDFLVEIGGELRVSGRNNDGDPWRIGIEIPDVQDNSQRGGSTHASNSIVGNAQVGLHLSDGGVATSGDYRNAFERNGKRYSHIIDARHGVPVSHNLASVTVVAESAMLADGWATALMVLGPDDGMKIAEELEIASLFIMREQAEQFTVTRSTAFEQLDGN